MLPSDGRNAFTHGVFGRRDRSQALIITTEKKKKKDQKVSSEFPKDTFKIELFNPATADDHGSTCTLSAA